MQFTGHNSSGKVQSVRSLLDGYFDKLQEQADVHKDERPTTYLQSLVEPYIEKLQWTNETFFKDQDLFFIKCSQLFKRMSEYDLTELLKWATTNNLHVRQFIRAVNTKLKRHNR
jgi:hypothetical protein